MTSTNQKDLPAEVRMEIRPERAPAAAGRPPEGRSGKRQDRQKHPEARDHRAARKRTPEDASAAAEAGGTERMFAAAWSEPAAVRPDAAEAPARRRTDMFGINDVARADLSRFLGASAGAVPSAAEEAEGTPDAGGDDLRLLAGRFPVPRLGEEPGPDERTEAAAGAPSPDVRKRTAGSAAARKPPKDSGSAKAEGRAAAVPARQADAALPDEGSRPAALRQPPSGAPGMPSGDVEAPAGPEAPAFSRLRERRTALPPAERTPVLEPLEPSGGPDLPEGRAAGEALPGSDVPSGAAAAIELLKRECGTIARRSLSEAARRARGAGRLARPAADPTENRALRARELLDVAAEIDAIVERARRTAARDVTDPGLPDSAWVAGRFLTDYIALLEAERRDAALEAEKLAREGVAVFLKAPGLDADPVTATEAWTAALSRRAAGGNDGEPPAAAAAHPAAPPSATPRSERSGGSGPAALRRTSGGGARHLLPAVGAGLLGGALSTALVLLLQGLSPAPLLVTADRERLRGETALLRLAHARPGMPERPELRELDAAAIDRAVAEAHAASRGAALPLVDASLVIGGTSPGVLDVTADARRLLGIREADLGTLEASVREGWGAETGAEGGGDPSVDPPPAPAGGDAGFRERVRRIAERLRGTVREVMP